MTICLIILFVLLLLNTTAFLLERARTQRELHQLKSTSYDLNESLYRTRTRIEEVNIKIYESFNDLMHKHKHLEDVVAGIEITLENLPTCPVEVATAQQTIGTPCADHTDTPKGKRRTYSEAEREQAVAYYEQHKSEGVSKTQAAKALGIPPSTYKSWF